MPNSPAKMSAQQKRKLCKNSYRETANVRERVCVCVGREGERERERERE